jgi:hypothetical protein
MKKFSNYFRMIFVLSVISFATACDDDAPEAENDAETITTLTLTFTPQGGGTALTFTAKDADGTGPGSIVVDDITLATNTTYAVNVSFLNELESPAENITAEITEEADEHRIFYTVLPAALMTISTTDQDSGGLPVGLTTSWNTGSPNQGSVVVTLKHQPDGIKTAASTINDGETDISVTFPVVVQ